MNTGHTDGSPDTTLEELMREHPHVSADKTAEEAAQALVGQGKAHSQPARPTATQRSSDADPLENLLRSLYPELRDDQVRHACTQNAPLLGLLDKGKLGGEDAEGAFDSAGAFEGARTVVAVLADQEFELEKARQSGAPEPPAPTLADVEATRRLRDYLRVEVGAVRTELFGTDDAPFATVEEAAEWLHDEGQRHAFAGPQLAAINDALAIIDAAGVRVDTVEARYIVLSKPETVQSKTLADLGRLMGRPPSFFLVGRSAALASLSDAQRRLSEQAGVNEWEVTRFILLDEIAVVRQWRPRVPPLHLLREGNPPLWFTLEIRDDCLAKKQVGEIFGELVRMGFVRPPQRLPVARQLDKQRRVYEFWQERRELAFEPLTNEDIARQWNTANRDEHLTRTSLLKLVGKERLARGEPPLSELPRLRARRLKVGERSGAVRAPAPQEDQGSPHYSSRRETVHPVVAMVNQAERALAGDTEAQRQIVADYEQVDPAAAHGLSANLQFDAETDALVARGLAGDPAALEEAVARVARVRGYWPAEELRASFGQAHDQETVADDHDTTDRDHVNDGAGNV